MSTACLLKRLLITGIYDKQVIKIFPDERTERREERNGKRSTCGVSNKTHTNPFHPVFPPFFRLSLHLFLFSLSTASCIKIHWIAFHLRLSKPIHQITNLHGKELSHACHPALLFPKTADVSNTESWVNAETWPHGMRFPKKPSSSYLFRFLPECEEEL